MLRGTLSSFVQNRSNIFKPVGRYRFSKKNTQLVIGLCFLLPSSVNCENIWTKWIELADGLSIKFYAHCYREPSDWVRERMTLVETVPTSWQKTVWANVQLFDRAFLECDRVVVLSESCLPLKSPQIAYDFFSRLAEGAAVNKLESITSKSELKWRNIDLSWHQICEQWVSVCKKTYRVLKSNPELLEFYATQTNADNEIWITGILQILNRQDLLMHNEKNGYHVVNWPVSMGLHPLTYFGCPEKYRDTYNKNPNFTRLVRENDFELYCEKKGAIFMRKFDQTAELVFDTEKLWNLT